MSSHRFSAWDGTQDPLGPDVEEIFNRLSEDVFHGWDFETALRRMLSQGWRDKSGKRLMGLEEMAERLQRRRRKQLERYNLDGVFNDITEKLDNVLRMERQGIEERTANVEDESAKRILERVAAKRREQLANLPSDPGGAIRELQGYEFMEERAEQAFQRLLEEIKKGVVDTYFKEMTEQMQAMSGGDVAELRAMARDLNRLVREKLEGVPDAQRQRSYESFLERWGKLFPGAPPKVDDFLDEITKQMARMDSLMRSLSPEMRRQLGDLMDAVFGDPEMQAELAELGAGLEMLSPRGGLGSRYSFFGGEQLPLDEAMQLMGRLQSMEELERNLREVYRGGQIPAEARNQLQDLLGGDAARSLDQLARMAKELEARGLVQRDADGLRLTARGMRRIGQKALGDLFAQLRKDRFGEHTLARRGQLGERAEDSKAYEFGDQFDLDVERTVMNAIQRQASDGARARATIPHLQPEDFEVHRSDALTRSSTVLMLDMSRSMPLRGYFYAAKKVALALDSLIRSQFPRDSLHIIGFSDIAREISSADLPHLSVNEYVYGTNMQHGL
ncbi:MAG: VWA domain-containing protein, partial [Candidatus Dormibacteraeota bacterium]|nr:VWA domain-containing protein [Candidatus Dormibacteraeota bacterium]